MNAIFSIVLAVLVYPGVVAAVIAALLLTWIRQVVSGALSGAEITRPLHLLGELRGGFEREVITPDGAGAWMPVVATSAAVICPVLALVLLPVPGNPLVAQLGLAGDLAAEGGLVLGLPLARAFVGWAMPSPYTRLAADRGARAVAGIALPLWLTLAASGQQFSNMTVSSRTAAAAPSVIMLLAYALAAAAFAGLLPSLARVTGLRQGDQHVDTVAGELGELSGRDLALFRLGEALQLAAVAACFIAVFVQPFLRAMPAGAGRDVLWLAGVALTAIGIGAWEGIHGHAQPARDASALDGWSSWPMLLALAALVATAWALRGV